MLVIPRLDVIATHLIKKFKLLAISDKIQVESLALWTSSDNEYRQLPNRGHDKDLFLIRELQDITKEYVLDSYVKPEWINRIEILRQCEVATRRAVSEESSGFITGQEGRMEVSGQVARKLSIKAEDLNRVLWADQEENLVAKDFQTIASGDLLRQYNLSRLFSSEQPQWRFR